MEHTKTSYIPVVILILLYLLLAFFLFSYENYPVDDDWSYIKAAETYHHTGKMEFTSWTAMSLVFQVWWGTCFTKLFGYSIEMLRVSTLAISLLGLIFFCLLLRELKHSWHTSFWVVLLMLFNPFSFPLNFTFFTDHHFISLFLISIYFYYKAFTHNKDSYLLAASLVASCAILVRQNGILIPLSVFVYLLISERSFKTIVKKSLLILVLPLITFIIFTYWFNVIHGPTAEYLKQTDKLLENIRKPYLLLIKLVWRPFLILEFMGFCLLPLSFSLLPGFKELFNRKNYFLLLLFCLAGTIFCLAFGQIGLFPSVDLWLNGFRFAYISEYGYRGHFNILFFFYRILDFLSVASIVYLIFLMIKCRNVILKKFHFASPSFLILIIGIFQFLFLLVTRYKFSRYYLILIPFFLLVILEITRHIRVNKRIFAPLLATYILLSVAATQDFMSWNQLKWQVANKLNNTGVSLQKLSAGFAWDAWHCSQYSLDHPYEITPKKGDIPWWIEDLTPAIDPQYIISSSPVPTGFEFFSYFDTDRYNIIDSFEYFSLFFMKNMKIYVLKRDHYPSQQLPGSLSLEFLRNLKGARLKGAHERDTLKEVSVDIGGIIKTAWLQPSPSSASFRVTIPHGRCRLKAAVGMLPSCWDKPGDGVLFKILIDDILLENFFHVPGAVGIGQIKQFFRPRTYFLPSRTYFIKFIDPKKNNMDRKWQDISLDLSAFEGKVVDITFEVSGGPKDDNQHDEALWANATIESY